MHPSIKTYNTTQEPSRRAICKALATEIDRGLPDAESKVWHGGPVWFCDGNPVVGYWVRKKAVQLLFWSGQSFDEAGLAPEGKFKAAQMHYADVSEIDAKRLARWLRKAKTIQWDYKNIVKRRGVLVRIETPSKKRAAPVPPLADATAARVREILVSKKNVTEKTMMGKRAFSLDGTMCCTVGPEGLLIRVRPEEREALLGKPGVSPMTMGTRTMRGFVRIAPEAYGTKAKLAKWVERGCDAARPSNAPRSVTKVSAGGTATNEKHSESNRTRSIRRTRIVRAP